MVITILGDQFNLTGVIWCGLSLVNLLAVVGKA